MGAIEAHRVVAATGAFQRPIVPTIVPAETGALTNAERAAASRPLLVHMRAPVRPHIRTDHPAPCAHHASAKRAHRHLIWQPVAIDRRAVVAASRDAVDQ